MSEGNAEEVTRFVQAWWEKDPDPFIELCDPEVELLLPRNLLEGGSYKGRDGARQAFADGFEMVLHARPFLSHQEGLEAAGLRE